MNVAQKGNSSATPQILVMCTGNVCRSPIGEVMLRHHLALAGADAEVFSRGLGAPVGRAPHPFAVQVSNAHGVPIPEEKRAAQVNDIDLRMAVAVLVMDHGHRHEIQRRYPFASGKTFLTGYWQGNKEIDDPIHSPVEAFEQSWQDIDAGCKAWVEKLLAMGLVKRKA